MDLQPFVDSSDVAGDGEALRRRLERDGYLFVSGLLPRDAMVAHIDAHGAPMTGVVVALDLCKAKGLKIGLATSSSQC